MEASPQPFGWEGGPLRTWANTQTQPEFAAGQLYRSALSFAQDLRHAGATKGRVEASTQPYGWAGEPLRARANTQTGPKAATKLGLRYRSARRSPKACPYSLSQAPAQR